MSLNVGELVGYLRLDSSNFETGMAKGTAAADKLDGRNVNVDVNVDVKDADAKAKLAELNGQIKDKSFAVQADTAAANLKIVDLKQQIAKLDAAIKINADDTEAKAKLAELKQQLGDVKLKVQADTAAARMEIISLRSEAQRQAKLVVDADTAAASAKVAEVARTRDAKVNVDADTGAAEAKIAAVGASASMAGGNMSGLIAAGLALGPAIVPVAAAAAAAILGIGAAALAVGPMLGALYLGFSGISAAVGAMGKADAASAASGAAAAAARVSQANAIEGAQASLTNAQRSAAAAAVSAAQSVMDAERGVGDAQRSASAAVVTAISAQQTAVRALADAQRTASQTIATAVGSQQNAEQALASAQVGAKQSQDALTQSRVQAKQSIEDLTNAVLDGALSQRQANLNVQQTKLALDSLTANSTALQRAQAQLAYDQAKQQVTDLGVRQVRLSEQKAAADKAGVNGAANVVAAQQGVARSVAGVATAQGALVTAEAAVTEARRSGAEKVATAQGALVTAEAAVTEARRSGAEKVAVAQEAVTKALQSQVNSAASSAASMASAQRSMQQALAQTGSTGSSAMNAVNTAMAGLSPAGQAFAKFLYSLKPAFEQLKATAQGDLLPGVTNFLKSMMTQMPVINSIVGSAATALGGLFTAAGKALQAPFWKDFFSFLSDTVGPNIKTFGETLGALIQGFAALFQAFAPIGDTVTKGILGLAQAFASWATTLSGSSGFQAFMVYLTENGPKVWGLLGDLLTIAGKLIVGLAPLGAVILDVLGRLASTLAKLSPGQITAVALAIGAIFSAVTGNWLALAVIGIAGLVTAFQNSTAGIDGFGNKLSAFFSNIGASVQAALPGIITKLGAMGTAFVSWMQVALPAIAAQLVKWGKAFVEWIAPQIPPMLAKAGELLGALGTWILNTGLPWLGSHLLEWGTAFVKWVGPIIIPLLGELGKLQAKLTVWIITTALPAIITKLLEWQFAFAKWVPAAALDLIVKMSELALKLTTWIITTALPAIVKKLGEWALAFAKWVPGAALNLIVEMGKLQIKLGEWMITTALPAIVTNLAKWALAFIQWVRNTVAALPGELAHLLAVIVTWLGTNIKNAITTAFNGYQTIISGVWNSIASTASTVWGGIATALGKVWGGITGTFSTIWDGMKEKAASPIRFVVNTVFAGIAEMFNKVAKIVNLSIPVPHVAFDVGGYTGAGSKYQPAGVVHADEFVVRKESQNQMRANHPGVLDYINQYGSLPGYAAGGGVLPYVAMRKWAEQHFPGVGGSQYDYRPGTGSSYHATGSAVDLSPPSMAMFNTIYTAFHDRIAELIYTPAGARVIKNGKEVGMGFYGPEVAATHYNHVHWAMPGNMGDLASGTDILGPIIKWVNGMLPKIPGKGLMTDAAKGLPGKVLGGLGSVVSNAFSALAGTFTNSSGIGGGTAPSSTNQALGHQMMLEAGWGEGQWTALQALGNRESGWRTDATNPTSGAYGIPQALPGNKMAAAGADWQTNAITQITWMLGYIRDRYTTPIGAMVHENQYGWYADGTTNAAPGWGVVGENGPEIVGKSGPELLKFRGGETVVPNSALGGGIDYDRLARAMSRVQLSVSTQIDGREIGRAAVTHMDTALSGGLTMAGVS